MRFREIILYLCVVSACSGCGAKFQFEQAQKLENTGYYVQAGFRYHDIFLKYPTDRICPQALYRLSVIYQKKLKLYNQAAQYYKKLIEYYPTSEPWSGLAKQGLFDCPDYFPLNEGNFWIEGDSETEGRNMRAEWNCHTVSSGTYSVNKKLFAGAVRVADIKRYYRKENYELREYIGPAHGEYSIVLRYPFEEGKTWNTVRDGRKVFCRIVANNLSIKVKAGEFNSCLKVSEENPELPGSIKYNYYAPDAGWILTTISVSAGREHSNTELLSYKVLPGK